MKTARDKIYHKIRNHQIWDIIDNPVIHQLRDQISSRVYGQIGSRVYGQFGSRVYGQFGSQISNQIKRPISAAISI